MNDENLRLAAWASKTLSIFVSVVVPAAFIFRPRWGLNRSADIQLVALAVLSLIPNRWLVFSWPLFTLFLLAALAPFRVLLHASGYHDAYWGLVIAAWLLAALFYGPLALSLVLSRMRFLRGSEFLYA